MRKKLGVIMISCILAITASVIPVFAENDTTSSTTLGDVATELNNYIEAKYNFEVGSAEYMEFLVKQLMFDEDQELAERSDYEDLTFYASIYMAESNSPENTVVTEKGDGTKIVSLNDNFNSKSLAAAKLEIAISNAQDLEGINENDTQTTFATYSPSKAANYALAHGATGTANVPEFPKLDNDCTNFVSQCVNAGGKSMVKPSGGVMVLPDIYANNSYWYSHHHINITPVHQYKQTTSFIRVSDFYTYWKNHGATIINCSTNSNLRSKIKVGDIVQCARSNGSWYHSIIISCKKDGTWRYAGHTDDHKWREVSKITGVSKYRIIRL